MFHILHCIAKTPPTTTGCTGTVTSTVVACISGIENSKTSSVQKMLNDAMLILMILTKRYTPNL